MYTTMYSTMFNIRNFASAYDIATIVVVYSESIL